MKQVNSVSFLIPLLLCVAVPLMASSNGLGDETSINQLYEDSQADEYSPQNIQLNKENALQETNYQQQPIPQGAQTPKTRRPGLLRNIVTPVRRFLFPGIKEDPNQEFRLPSPVWLAAETANRVLPVLRAANDQFSPWIQTLATISKPKYLSSTQTEAPETQYKTQTSQQPRQYQNSLPSQQQNNGLYGNRLFPLLGRY